MNVWNTPDWTPKLPHVDNAWKSDPMPHQFDAWPPLLPPPPLSASQKIAVDVWLAQRRLAAQLSDHVALHMGELFKWQYPPGAMPMFRSDGGVEILFRRPSDCNHQRGQRVTLERFFIGGEWEVRQLRAMVMGPGMGVKYARVDV